MHVTLDLIIVWINAGLSLTAAVVLMLAAFGESMPELRPIRFAGAVLAAIYFGAYIGLAMFWIDSPATWSQYLRPIGLLAWPIIWITPTVIENRTWRKISKAIGHTRDAE